MQDFDQNFSNTFRGCYPRIPTAGGGHTSRILPQPMVCDYQYFRRSAATVKRCSIGLFNFTINQYLFTYLV